MNRKTMTKSGGGIIITIVLLFSFGAPLAAFGLSYPASLYHKKERHEQFVPGELVYLFHSGTDGVKETIHINNALDVYRVTPTCQVVPVGRVLVISFVGETYIKGLVISGEIRPDDIAKKDKVSCLIISAEVCNK